MIRRCDDRDLEMIWAIINDGAQAYRGDHPRRSVDRTVYVPGKASA